VTVSVFVENRAGRKGVPLRRSFQQWIDAIPELRKRRAAEVAIVVVDADEGRDFNQRFRHRDYATNVLSFPYERLPGDRSGLLGDLVVCAPVVAREAREQGKNARDHYAHMTIHGVLHLLGHEHENDKDAQRMEALETRILAGLGIADPYASER
jgi:probable rRNA maturation factor